MALHELYFNDLKVAIETDTDRMMADYGPRFDCTAQVVAISRGEHAYLDGRGLVDEIGLQGAGVLGYDESELGSAFAKIGVGLLERDDPGLYSFARRYPLRAYFPVELLEANQRQLRVRQEGWLRPEVGFRWEKTYRLESAGELSLTCRATNLGSEAWAFEHYNHNFLSFDGAVVDSSYRVELGFPHPKEFPTGSLWQLRERTLQLVDTAPENGGVRWGCDLAGARAVDNQVTVTHAQGGRMEILGDFAPARFALWAIRSTLCPEVFWRERLEPGTSAQAIRRYLFS